MIIAHFAKGPHRPAIDAGWYGQADIGPFDAAQIRWLYRMLRREGVRASTARMYISTAYNVGCRTQMNVDSAKRRESAA